MWDAIHRGHERSMEALKRFADGDSSSDVVDWLLFFMANRLDNYLFALEELKKDGNLPEELELFMESLTASDYERIQETVLGRHPDWKQERESDIQEVRRTIEDISDHKEPN